MKSNWDNYFTLRNVAPADYSAYSLPAYVRDVLPADKSKTVCDIGCGFGQSLLAIRRLGYKNIVGIEPSADGAQKASELGIRVVQGIVEDATCQAVGQVDFAYMSHVLEHIPKSSIVSTLTTIRQKLLIPGGRLLVAVPNAQSYTGPYWRYEDWTHTTLFTAGSLSYVLRAAGFTEVNIVDSDCLAGRSSAARLARRLGLGIYKAHYRLMCRLTNSATHRSSENVFSFEVKALAM